jgi:hypothetical protein
MNNYLKRGLVVGGLAMTLTAGIFIGQATARQNHMYAALDSLQTAKSELQAAESNKGGHRARALDYVNSAIDEVHAGINYAE